MSLLDAFSSLASQASGQSGEQPSTDQHISTTQAVLQHFGSQPSGLSGLLNQFRENGMGSHVDSWLSPQANQPVAPEQVEQGVGPGAIDSIAQKAGLSPQMTKIALATVLPMLISHLSHGSGELPAQSNEGGGLASLAQSIFSR